MVTGSLATLRQLYDEKKDRILFAVLMIALLLVVADRYSVAEPPEEPDIFEADTFIPRGFSLVPIELENQEALNSLIGPKAVVNLYKNSPLGDQKGRLIGRNLRLLRAPLNPDKFAVLVPVDEVPLFMSQAKFYATLQNRVQPQEMVIENPRPPSSRPAVEFYKGERR